MSTALTWNTSGSREVATVARPKWRELRQGFVLAGLGHILLLGPALLGLIVLHNDAVGIKLGLDLDDTEALGWALLGVGLLTGYTLLLLGQLRCLWAAPQGHGAKDMQFACLLCSLVALPLFIAGYFLGGREAWAESGLRVLLDLDLRHGGALLQVGSLVVVVMSILLFSNFARAVARCLRDEKIARRLGFYLWLVAFLVGGTAGGILEARWRHRLDVMPLLLLGWLICLAGHVLLIRATSRGIARFLRQQRSRAAGVRTAAAEQGQTTLRSAAYLQK